MTDYDRFLLKCFGFRDGAGGRPMSPQREFNQEYATAYVDGQKVKRVYAKRYAAEFSITDHDIRASILRNKEAP
jgi:hypothetical protein